MRSHTNKLLYGTRMVDEEQYLFGWTIYNTNLRVRVGDQECEWWLITGHGLTDDYGATCLGVNSYLGILEIRVGNHPYNTLGTFRRGVKLVLNPSTAGVQKINMT